jgi:hypothetical protein
MIAPGWLAPMSIGTPTMRMCLGPCGRAVRSEEVELAEVIMAAVPDYKEGGAGLGAGSVVLLKKLMVAPAHSKCRAR